MRTISKSCILTFSSTHHALRAEELIEEQNIELDIIPIPREITAECGLAIRVSYEQKEQVEEILTNNKINMAGIYSLDADRKIDLIKKFC